MDKNKILEDYIGNDMKKIRKICKKIISKTNIPDGYLEEYYDKAVDVLMESMNTYDESRDCKFSTYFYGNLVRRTGTWLRDRMRFKRCNLETDSKGKIKRDEDGNPIIIPDMSINMQIDLDEDYTLENSIASDFNLEKEVGLYMNESDERVEEFLNSLPDIHRKFLELKMEGSSHQDILDKLHINEWKYNDILAKIKINEGLSVFFREPDIEDFRTEDKKMQETIMEIGVAEEYRMDKYSLSSLLKKKANGDINCKYILQRKAFQWTTEEVNRFLARILSGLPIPEIVICDKDNKETKKVYRI